MRRRSRSFLLLLLVLVLLVGSGIAGLAWWFAQPLPVPAGGVAFDVKSGSTLKGVARELETMGVLPDQRMLVALARWNRADRAIKAGNYEIPAGITLSGLLARLTQGDVTQVAVTVVEGATFRDFRRALAAHPQVARVVADLPDDHVMARLGMPGAPAEGWFFPETYFFAAGAQDVAILKRAHLLMRRKLEAAWDGRAPDLPLRTPYDALILASIVEKETGRAADRPLVASVFLNRLRAGMKLQTDPTVIYGLGDRFDGNLHKRDLEADTPYNTYTREGLPPTPIALPSQASLDAVMHPPKTPYLYFVSRGDGTSEFSANLADHTRAVNRYQKGGH